MNILDPTGSVFVISKEWTDIQLWIKKVSDNPNFKLVGERIFIWQPAKNMLASKTENKNIDYVLHFTFPKAKYNFNEESG